MKVDFRAKEEGKKKKRRRDNSERDEVEVSRLGGGFSQRANTGAGRTSSYHSTPLHTIIEMSINIQLGLLSFQLHIATLHSVYFCIKSTAVHGPSEYRYGVVLRTYLQTMKLSLGHSIFRVNARQNKYLSLYQIDCCHLA